MSGKKLKYSVLFLLCLVFSESFSQEPKNKYCGTNINLAKSLNRINSVNTMKPSGGKYLPSKGYIKGLVIFIQLKDDTYSASDWKINEIPAWSKELPTRVNKYFKSQSFNQLDIDLDIYPYPAITKLKEYEYLNQRNDYGTANKDVLADIDKNISFLPYDNWTIKNSYQHFPGQDGQVDLIVMIYRRVTNSQFLGYSGIADLGFVYLTPVDNGKRYVWGGYNMHEYHDDGSASGVTICNAPGSGQLMTLDVAEKLIIHEVGHKFFGEGHPIYNFAYLGLMSSIYGGEGMSSFERFQMGYLNYIKIDSSTVEPLELKDYMTTGEAALVSIPNLPNQYYIIENRQKISDYDGACQKGLYIYLLNYGGDNSSLDIQTADGKWDWALDSNNNLVKVKPNPTKGRSHLETVNINDYVYYPPDLSGNNLDAFYDGYKTLYAPWTNPTSNAKINFAQEYQTNIAVSLVGKSGYNLRIAVSFNAINPPSKDEYSKEMVHLGQNYPNPFNSSTRIEYFLPSAGDVNLTVYNTLGQEVAILINGFKPEGKHMVELDLKNLPSGIYYYKLKGNNQKVIKKLIYMK